MKVKITKDAKWQVKSFAKAPLELLLCDDLLPTAKLLWIFLANQADYRPIDRAVLDKRLGIHRSTRIRAMKELRRLGFISGTDISIVVHDPYPILERLEREDIKSRQLVKSEIYGLSEYENFEQSRKKLIEEQEPEAHPHQQSEQSTKARPDYSEQAKEAWNQNRPPNYSKIRVMSLQLLKAVDLHMKALGLDAHDYEAFFSVLKKGVNASSFWVKENNNKTLSSIIGIGQPTMQKYQNVSSLFNQGFEEGDSSDKDIPEKADDVVLPASFRSIINEYDELHFMYQKLQHKDPESLKSLKPRIIKVESAFLEAGLDPSLFRMKYSLSSWPTDVPEPIKPRQQFWRYQEERF